MATIYRPTLLYPKNISLDMSTDQDFSCIIDGERITGYELNIYDNSDNSLVYQDTTTFTSENYLYNNATLTVTVPNTSGCTNGNEYKWNITYYNSSEGVTSQEALFYAEGSPTFTISVPTTVSGQSYDFVGEYSHPNNVGVRYWYYHLYDSSGSLLQETDRKYNSNITYHIDGLIAGQTYTIQGFLQTEQGTSISTSSYSFNVSYTPTIIDATPTVSVSQVKASLILSLTLEGEVDGEYSYVSNLFVNGNYGIDLEESSTNLNYTFITPDNFTARLCVVLTTEFDGDIIKFSNTENDDYFLVGYDDTVEKFYYNINGTIAYSEELYPVSKKVFTLVLTPGDLDIIENVHEDAQYTTNDGYEFFDNNEDFLFVQYEA